VIRDFAAADLYISSMTKYALALALAAALTTASGVTAAQQPSAQTPATPDFTVQVWGEIVAEFTSRVQHYYELREMAAVGAPPLVVTDNPNEIERTERTLARRIRQARGPARPGDIFTPEITTQFRIALREVLDEKTLAVIMDDNPGEFTSRVDRRYPKTRSYSTVPANVLALLPRLPDDIQYRFLGRHLILLDVRANLILDRLPCAISCN
jgi:hypothetical protein